MKFEKGDSILAARHLIGARVVDSEGKTLGHAIDMEVDPTRDFRVVGIELGRHGWIDRIRALRPLAHDRLGAPPRIVAWRDIDRYEDGKLICRPGAKVVEIGPTEQDEAATPNRTAAGG